MQRMLAEAKAADAEEDAHYGPDRRGDELPEGLGGRTERLRRLKEAKERLQREAEAAARAVQERVEQRRAEEVATGKKKRGRKPKVVESLPTEEAKANTTDPDSRIMKTRQGYVQGYNAQAVVSEGQIIVASLKMVVDARRRTSFLLRSSLPSSTNRLGSSRWNGIRRLFVTELRVVSRSQRRAMSQLTEKNRSCLWRASAPCWVSAAPRCTTCQPRPAPRTWS